jgi:hypothetical protein
MESRKDPKIGLTAILLEALIGMTARDTEVKQPQLQPTGCDRFGRRPIRRG